MPATISGGAVQFLTINGQPATPESMQAAGYTYNQATYQWVLPGAQTGAGGGGAGGTPQSDNNWQTNPALYQYVWNRDAKNRNSRYTTTLKHAMTQWRRAKKRAKGIYGPQGEETPVVAAPAPAATNAGGAPTTVLELRLGSG